MEQISYKIVMELQKHKSHLRALASKLEINHMTIQRKLHKLKENNVVDYEQEGKNNVYFLKKSIEAKIYLKMAEQEKLLDFIKKQPRFRSILEKLFEEDVDLALLFGSYAKGTQTKNSDIDMYLNTQDKRIKEKLELLDSKINIKLGIFNKENLLIQEIINNHIILKGVDKYYELIN